MSETEPKLAPPGAGIPWWSKLFARYIYFPKITQGSWDDANRVYEAQMRKILDLVAATPPQLLTQRALVPPIQGLEDSSRYWSIQMTLEHLVIVSEGIGQMIGLLSQGRVPPIEVDTAKVKPLGEETVEESLRKFRSLAETHVSRINAATKDRASKTTHPHPWFGPFTAHQWNWLLGVHAGVHRQQIKEIRKALGC